MKENKLELGRYVSTNRKKSVPYTVWKKVPQKTILIIDAINKAKKPSIARFLFFYRKTINLL